MGGTVGMFDQSFNVGDYDDAYVYADDDNDGCPEGSTGNGECGE